MPKKKKDIEELEFVEPEVLEEFVLEQVADDKDVLVTKDGLESMKEELAYLKMDGRKKVAERLKEAISFGDLSENSEYEEAKNEQGFIEGRISELERKIKNAKIISGSKTSAKTVGLGSTVTVKNLSKSGEVSVFTIVGSTEADPFKDKISNESPVGSALLEKQKGDKLKVVVPAGVIEYEISKID